ncbi:hypothetical protein DFR72_104240 [Lentzea flaviverrucosa]|nr:hypothetical protein DFR72_104240 [Lentzea flaviverrucosa]
MSDEPRPGVVEVQLTDADGAVWSFVEKFYVFDADDDAWLDAVHPFEVEVGCEIFSRHADASGRDLVTVSTRPSYVATAGGRDQFTVTPSQLVRARCREAPAPEPRPQRPPRAMCSTSSAASSCSSVSLPGTWPRSSTTSRIVLRSFSDCLAIDAASS